MDSLCKQRVESIATTNGCEDKSKEEINKSHDEYQYLNLIQHILSNGEQKSDRTGTGTLSVFGTQSRYSLRDGTSYSQFIKQFVCFGKRLATNQFNQKSCLFDKTTKLLTFCLILNFNRL